MTNGQRIFAALLCVLTSLCTVASARTPLDFLEVVAVTPSRVITIRCSRRDSRFQRERRNAGQVEAGVMSSAVRKPDTRASRWPARILNATTG
jgi:hypothetical protein